MSSPSAFDAFRRRYDSGEYFTGLAHAPAPHRLRRPPELVYQATLHDRPPRFSLVMPAFNHGDSVEAALAAAAVSASLPFDCIVVDDGSEDDTVERAASFFASRQAALVAHATILRNPVPVFETACDNLGFALAETEIIVELQADIQIREPAFDAIFLRAAAIDPAPSALSGRCGHTFRSLRSKGPLRSVVRQLFPPARESIGLCGAAIDTPAVIEPIRRQIYRCETVNRGPWVVRKSDLERHGYLDERHFFLGNDDHDYHRRLFEAEGRRPLYVAIALHAPLTLGAARRRRTGINREVFDALAAEKRGSPEFHRFLDSIDSTSLPELLRGIA